MSTYLLLVFGVALLLTGALVPPVIRIAMRLDAVSRPGGRHVHGRVTPRMGGVAIVIGFFVAWGLAAALLSSEGTPLLEPHMVGGLVGGGLAMTALGFFDDTRGLRAKHKLLVQILVATAAYVSGLRIETVYVPFIGTLELGLLAAPATVFWIVAIINAINLIDGLDGLAGGVVFFAAMTNLVVALVAGNEAIAITMAGLMGATLGFLLFNFNPARIFMGDSGSYLLGFVLAVASIAGPSQKTSTAVSILVPLVALGLPIFDTLFAIVRRFLKGQPMFSADRGHIHHRLLDLGITPRRAVLILYAVSTAFTLAAVAIAIGRDWQVGLAIVAASATVACIVRFVIAPAHRVRRDHAYTGRQEGVEVPRMVTATLTPRPERVTRSGRRQTPFAT